MFQGLKVSRFPRQLEAESKCLNVSRSQGLKVFNVSRSQGFKVSRPQDLKVFNVSRSQGLNVSRSQGARFQLEVSRLQCLNVSRSQCLNSSMLQGLKVPRSQGFTQVTRQMSPVFKAFYSEQVLFNRQLESQSNCSPMGNLNHRAIALPWNCMWDLYLL
jgi:hypothetical protein